MYSRTVVRLLELSPMGLTNEQLLWRLRQTGLRPGAEEIMHALAELSQSGVTRILPGGRWRLARFDQVRGQERSATRRPAAAGSPAVLAAAMALVSGQAPPDESSPIESEAEQDASVAPADWRKLLAYYASTQRADPRGRVDERSDGHGMSWQLFRADGGWWETSALRFAREGLPETFREALTRRPAAVCSLGYPVCLFDQVDVPSFVPALLLPASYRWDGTDLVVEPTGREPALNPLWLEIAVRRSRWSRDKLTEALFPAGEDLGFAAVAQRLGNAFATLGGGSLVPARLAGELTLAGEGLRNNAGLFLPSDASFTQGAERDLSALCDWPEPQLRQTALWSVLTDEAARRVEIEGDVPAPCGPRPLTQRQYDAAREALAGPLTVIQGPPGTGKSEVILALVSSIVLSGGSVLFAARNHQALDEVEHRLTAVIGDVPLLTRARDGDGGRDTNFFDQMGILANAEPANEPTTNGAELVVRLARELLSLRRRRQHHVELHLRLSDAAEELARWDAAVPVSTSSLGRWWRMLIWLRRLVRREVSTASRDDCAAQMDRLKCELEGLQAAPSEEETDLLADEVAREVEAVALAATAAARTVPDAAAQRMLSERVRELAFNRTSGNPRLTAEDARLVVRHRPVWVLSTLSAGPRVPLLAGLFDYVIFDEASQCDIASSLPLLARARRAVVVGDPEQLGFVPQLSNRQEHALMDAAVLPVAGRYAIAQSSNSLFDFARGRKAARYCFLADQFRSAPEIVAYLNEAFYQGRLVASRDEDTLRRPTGYRPGLAWHDVRGRAVREDGGNVNHEEAQAVVDLVVDWVRLRGFDGSIGVLSPFNTQVALLTRRLAEALSPVERETAKLRVSTIDRFQGGEADVVLFSTVVTADAHRGAVNFYARERRRVNVAVSRARALCLVVGDQAFARASGVSSLAFLAEACERPPRPRGPFDSEWERRLDAALKRRGIEALPQYPVGSRYLDFAIDPEGIKLDVEVDGRRWHADPDGNRKQSDRLRDRELIARGWRVRRFWVHELAEDMEKCLDLIERDRRGG